MKRILLALALVVSPALAEESKPIATQVGDAMRPAAEAYGNTMTRLVNELFAGSKGVMGEAARANLQDHREREASCGPAHHEGMRHASERVDEEVKECIEGIRVKRL